jgi:hypothetical protein
MKLIMSQIVPIKDTHAYTVITLRDIHPQESITVSYTATGYYEAEQQCMCASCCPGAPPIARKRTPPLPALEGEPKKKRHRSGRKWHRRRKEMHTGHNLLQEREGNGERFV